jgi:predicted transcriptional regulator
MQTHSNTNQTPASVLDLTGKVVTAFLEHNPIGADAVPGLIERVHGKLATLSGTTGIVSSAAPVAASGGELIPAVPIDKSITPEYIICLEDGQKFQIMKRHLDVVYHMTPQQYREKWNLPKDYPMVAPNYSEARAVFARKIGLGRKPVVKQRKKPGPKVGWKKTAAKSK